MELEHRRRLAVERILEGYSVAEVADFLSVSRVSVRRWVSAFERRGPAGLTARPVPGRPGKLTRTQEKIVLRWLADKPTEHGFATDLWSSSRLAQLICQEWDIAFNPRYLAAWLRKHDFSLQKPQRVPRERNPEVLAAWLQRDWPRIKKKRAGTRRT